MLSDNPSLAGTVDMPAKHRVPRLNQKLACFKLLIRRSRIERFGVFAGEAIPAHKRVIQYTGERISARKAIRRAARRILAGKETRVYLVRVNRHSSFTLDGSVGGSGAERINHSCDPNLTIRRIGGQVFLYSLRKIREGEELTLNYGFRCSFPCNCGSSRCRGTMCQVT